MLIVMNTSIRMRILARLTLLSLGFLSPLYPAIAAELIFVEQPGCAYCARWEAEIAPIYPKTPEAQIAPLREVRLRSAELDAIDTKGAVIFTPTFLLVEDGRELARIEGYVGDELFWSMLTVTLRKQLGFELDPSKNQNSGG